jgi:hypothetical protein
MSGTFSTNGGEEEHIYLIGWKVRGKGGTRTTKTEVSG